MKILVTGADGQLGTDLCQLLNVASREVVPFTLEEADFSRPDRVRKAVRAVAADWVINCAAYTQVDRAESEPELAYLVNRDSAGAVAEAVKDTGGRLLHVSTDFVFDGASSSPYREEDAAGAPAVYGQSKWEGEQAVKSVLADALIVRTAWVYGANGHNFVKTMLRLAAERDELTVVDDQVGTPSWTRDIAGALLALIDREASGVYHYTNEGVASWYDFASSIIEEARAQGFPLKVQAVRPISTRDYPTPARRPAYSVLSKEKIRACLDAPIPHWRESLRNMLKELPR